MKRKFICLALAGALLLTGCSLARPEREAAHEDVFCGFYAVTEQEDARGQIRSSFDSNPYLEVYGSETYDVEGVGDLSFDRKVLFGVEDEAGNVTFPGMEGGYRLLLFTRADPGKFRTSVIQSDMGPGEEGTKITSTDEGDSMSASGTIYLGPPLGAGPDWAERDTGTIWTLFRVYQARDGRLYLDGTGNSYGGAGGWTVSEQQTYRRTENGETAEETTVSISVKLETIVSRLERLTVYQYGPDSTLLRADDIPLEEDPQLTATSGAAWLVAEESYANGTAKHTAYDLGETDICHGFVLLDDAGCGVYTTLTIAP